eukprot:161226-Hanusia_phi.AAC.1
MESFRTFALLFHSHNCSLPSSPALTIATESSSTSPWVRSCLVRMLLLLLHPSLPLLTLSRHLSSTICLLGLLRLHPPVHGKAPPDPSPDACVHPHDLDPLLPPLPQISSVRLFGRRTSRRHCRSRKDAVARCLAVVPRPPRAGPMVPWLRLCVSLQVVISRHPLLSCLLSCLLSLVFSTSTLDCSKVSPWPLQGRRFPLTDVHILSLQPLPSPLPPLLLVSP